MLRRPNEDMEDLCLYNKEVEEYYYILRGACEEPAAWGKNRGHTTHTHTL